MVLNLFFSYCSEDTSTFQIGHMANLLKRYSEIEDVYYYQEISFEDIYEYIQEYVKKSDVMILFCSENSIENKYVKMEWKGALDIGKKIIPIFENEDSVPIPLRGHLRVKFNKEDLEGKVKEIYGIILKICNIRVIEQDLKEITREFFRGIHLPKNEVETLEEIESITEKSFEFLEDNEFLINENFRHLAFLLNEENSVQGIGIKNCKLENLPNSIKNIKTLNTLVLSHVELKDLPDWITDINHLGFLCLSDNYLSKLPERFVDLNYLDILDLSNNNISFLPESFGFMEFQILFLNGNKLATLPFSFLNIKANEIYLNGNPLEREPDLKTRYIIEVIHKFDPYLIDIELPEFIFEFEQRDKDKIDKINKLIEEYYSLYSITSEEFLESERWQDKICYELIEIGYTSIDRLLDDEFLLGDLEIQYVAEEILRFILCDIEPNWKEIVTREDFFI